MQRRDRPTTRSDLWRTATRAAVAVAALWAACGVVLATDLVVDWTDDVCAEVSGACPPEVRASVESARATDRLARTVIVGAAALATVTAGFSVERTRRRRRAAVDSARRRADHEFEWYRSDFADAARLLGHADPVTASSLLVRLERAVDAEPALAADLGRIVSVAVRHWDGLRRAETDPLAARERREAVEEAVAVLARCAGRIPVDLSGVDLDGLRLDVGDGLAGAILHDTELNEAGLGGVDLTGADLSGAVLTGADLDTCDLQGATLNGAHVDVANLRSADLMAVDARGADFDRSDLGGADLSLARCSTASFLRARLRGARLTRADLTRARLHRADLTDADLSGATLTESDLRRARLCSADLSEALLNGADLTGADLRGADLASADLGGAWLEGVLHDETTRWPVHDTPAGGVGRVGPSAVPTTTAETREPNAFWDAPDDTGPVAGGSGPPTVTSGHAEPDVPGEAGVRTHWGAAERTHRQGGTSAGLHGGDRPGDDRPGVLRQ